jgi:hypothetical protein
MQSLPLVRRILRDDALTRGLGDIEARMIVDWLTDRAEIIADELPAHSDEADGWFELEQWCVKARTIGRFVRLWAKPATRGSAIQLAAAERSMWPLPTGPMDLGVLMENLLAWEDRQDEIRLESRLAREGDPIRQAA